MALLSLKSHAVCLAAMALSSHVCLAVGHGRCTVVCDTSALIASQQVSCTALGQSVRQTARRLSWASWVPRSPLIFQPKLHGLLCSPQGLLCMGARRYAQHTTARLAMHACHSECWRQVSSSETLRSPMIPCVHGYKHQLAHACFKITDTTHVSSM